jgi:Raf kinase inhibitor-like YbhB/YbcL family protein
MPLKLSSPSFENESEIPVRHTCEGDDVSPALEWTGAPRGTKSFVLIVDDPDAPDPAAPERVWTHWVLYDMPETAGGLDQDVSPDDLPDGTREGLNDWDRTGWGGPCPPIGRHRYFHRLYALDAVLGDLGRPTKKDVERAMEGHVLEMAQLMGTYQKRGN